jgi:23S rRNA (cytidine1920-2'-O)/16S rRNA (cytidine1409-2'-O)-methyltransferase
MLVHLLEDSLMYYFATVPPELLQLMLVTNSLLPELLNNPRVQSFEGINAREVTLDQLRELTGMPNLEIDLVVADLSFISLTLVLPALAALAPKADFVLLIKPQFEVGKQSLRPPE